MTAVRSQQTGGVVQRSGQSADTSVMSQQGGIFPDAPGGPEGDGAEISSNSQRRGHQNAHKTFECWLVDTQKTQLIRRFSMIIEGSGPGL